MTDFCLMTSYMFVQIALLREGQVAAQGLSERANKRSFLGVDSQVVIEVMPLSEIKSAALMVTSQNFKEAMSLGVFEFEDSELAC